MHQYTVYTSPLTSRISHWFHYKNSQANILSKSNLGPGIFRDKKLQKTLKRKIPFQGLLKIL